MDDLRQKVHENVFTPALARSNFYVQMVVRLLEHRGWTDIEFALARTTPDRASAFTMSDDGDIYATKHGVRCRIEVKMTSYPFQNRASWRFPQFYLFPTHRWDDADPKPRFAVCISVDMMCFAIVDLKATRHSWKIKRGVPHGQGLESERPMSVYWIDPDDVTEWILVPYELQGHRLNLLTFDQRFLEPTK